MSWMNEGDIDEALMRFKPYPNLHRGARIIADLRHETNRCSDGWPYWSKPAHAARQLMELLDLTPVRRGQKIEDITPAQLTKALAPIKSFYTRAGYKAGMTLPRDLA